MGSSSSTPVYRHGLKVWHAPQSPNVDICFIHGLNGDRDKTWTSDHNEMPWPEQFLARAFPDARLLTYGYDSSVVPFSTASTGTLRTIADGFNRSLKDNRELARLQTLPIVFVAHRLGGLVCKQAIYVSFHSQDAEIKAIALCLLGIIFIGTPHTGLVYANFFMPLVSRNSLFKSTGEPLLRALLKDGETATDLNEDFVGVVNLLDRRTNIYCFFEGKPMPFVKYLIVNRASAILAPWPSLLTNSDHSNMVKFQSDADPNFQTFCSVLRDFLSSERAAAFSSLRPPAAAHPAASEALPQPSTHIPSTSTRIPQPTASLSGNGHLSQGQHSPNPSHITGSQFSLSDADQEPIPNGESDSISDQDSVTGQCNNPPIRPSTPPLLFDPTATITSHPHTLPMQSNTDPRPQPISHLYFSKNRDFIGREDTLENLQSLFFDDGYNTVALSGLGGIGKTQVANAFAYWLKESKPDMSVIWLPAVTRATFEEAYSTAAKKLSIKVENKGDLLNEVCDYINQNTARPWFIIIDNADDPMLVCDKKTPNTLDRYFPRGDHVRTLVTTRTKIVASTLADETVELVAFGPEHAVEMARRLLEKKTEKKWSLLASDGSSVQALLQELEYLPLAISQAMAYMYLTDTRADEYLQLLRATDSSRVDLLGDEQPDRNRYKESAHAVATTWLVSFDHIQKTNPNAVTMLEFLSQVLPKAVPRSMLPMVGSEAANGRAIKDLQAYNFVSRQGDLFDMHRLVHVAALSWVDKNGKSEKVNRSAFEHMSKTYPFPKYENQPVWSQYLPHAVHMVDYKTVIASVEEAVLCLRLVSSFFQEGRSREAVRYGEMGHSFTRHFLPEDNEIRLAIEYALAGAYKSNGQIQEAVQLLEHVVQIREKTLAEDHPSRLASQHELAWAYQSNGQIQKAVQLLEHVVQIHKKTLAEDHPSRLASQHELARAYRSNGQIQKAVQLLEHVVQIREKTLAEDHPSRLTSQHTLAWAYQSNGQIQKAVQLLEHVVQIHKKTLAEDHPSRLASQHELARAYRSNGQIQKAVQLLEHVVQIREKTLAEDHPDRLTSQHTLARAYRSNGQIQKAVQLLEHVVQIHKKTLAEDHPDRLASQHELARAYRSNGQIQKAVQLLEHVVQVQEKTLAEDHPNRLVSLTVLASCLIDIGSVERAKTVMRHVVAISQVSMPDHPDCKMYKSDLSYWEETYPDA